MSIDSHQAPASSSQFDRFRWPLGLGPSGAVGWVPEGPPPLTQLPFLDQSRALRVKATGSPPTALAFLTSAANSHAFTCASKDPFKHEFYTSPKSDSGASKRHPVMRRGLGLDWRSLRNGAGALLEFVGIGLLVIWKIPVS